MGLYNVVLAPSRVGDGFHETEMKVTPESGSNHLVYLVDTTSTWDLSFKYRSNLGFSFFISGSTGTWGGMEFEVLSNVGQQQIKTITGITLSTIGNIIGVAFGSYWSIYSSPGTLWLEIGEIEFHKTSLGGNTHILNGGGTGESVFVDSDSDGLADNFSMWIVGATNLITQVHDADTNFDVRHQFYQIDFHPGDKHFLVGTYS